MMYDLIIDDRALLEAADAYQYYEEAQPGLGDRFFKSLEQQIEYIRFNPKHFACVKGNIRQVLVPRFPYLIFYEHIAGKVAVYSVFHTSQDPAKKP
ncbi:MAG: type II toxin-antitoxin system RelE/ParE family toxin [Bacteroidetes bacterium]|nr:type II toxin-antitoxin system RelE/ParE family toxin [Bacteroidota bacterium]